MSDSDERFEFAGDAADREYGSVALVAGCIVAVILATTLIPAAASVGLGGAPAESLIPVPPGADQRSGGGNSGGGFGTGDGFGALNLGNRTSVGGSLGESDGNPFRSQNTEVHFQVRSEESGYWRTGAYDTYTGDGWSQSGTSDATAPVEGRQVRYRVDLARPTTSAPAVWRPLRVDGPDSLELTDGGLARADEPLPEGTSYVGVSRKPPRDPEMLRATGRDYPDAIERRYTKLPPSSAVSLRPFTNNVTEGADTPYETAVRIEEWLEANKEYSLNVSQPSGDHVAREFVTQMDAGYCEYFATAMTAMLRSQEIPARYVVGYSTGQQVGANTFQVRAMNAHAWVEVYFEGVGWVRFDPTPGTERLQQEEQSYEESGEPGEYSPQEEGSPGETFSPDPGRNNGTATATPADPGGDDRTVVTPQPTPNTPGGEDDTPVPSDPADPSMSDIEVTLNRTAVPGAVVEVSVTVGAQPIVGALVEFDGEPIGRTDRGGTVAGRVPYTENLSVNVIVGRTVDSEAPSGAALSMAEPLSLPPPDADSLVARAQPDNTTRSFDVSTEATLSVSGDVATGETALVTATVDGVPVENARVTLDGEPVARTDDGGQARVRLPGSPGNVTLGVDRDPVAGSQTLRLAGLTVSAEPIWPLPVAGTPVEVSARLGNDSVAGAPVRIGGERVGETGVDGTLRTRLPLESAVPIAVETDGQTARTTVSNPIANAAGVVVAALAVLVGAAVTVGRRSLRPRSLVRSLAVPLRTAGRLAVRAFVGAAIAAAARIERTLDHLAALVSGERSPAELVRAFRSWVAAWAARLRRPVDRRTPSNGRGTPADGDGSGSAEDDAAHVTIREAWGRFLGTVSVNRPWTKTPGQLADHAVSADGLPADAVATLRDEFRAVEYGPRSPDDSAPAVEAAIDRIERAIEPAESSGDAADAADGEGDASAADGDAERGAD
ncbi:transglutaminase domain-containing protein [Halosimplex sp. TS25]|uniref:transglutaminase domain-containing protein n=1 Tax=Halosimplex rarum TaxID=3396619 RepID=UPI0039EBB9DA